MGTRIELHRFGAIEDDAMIAARRAIEAVDDALTILRPSATTAVNECLMAGREAAVDDPVLFDALVEIEGAYAATLGLFDPAVDARLRAAGWQFHGGMPRRAWIIDPWARGAAAGRARG